MKRRRSLVFDSLELLLDTICNTFGGILFLSVLIIVLLHRAGQTISPSFAKESALHPTSSLPSDLERQQAELQSLERAFREYQATLAGLESQQAADRARRVLNMRSLAAELASRRMERMRQFASLSQEATQLEQLKQQSASAVVTASKEVKSLEEKLEIERKNRTRTANLPVLRQTAKREFPVILRFGRLYLPFVAGTSLASRKSNLDEFVVIDDSGPVFRVVPKPYAGLPIDDSDQCFEALRRRLASLDGNSVYLAIGVWEDSFEQFQHMREAVVRLGYEYRLIPVSSGDFIQESPVQEVLVQ